MGGRILVVDDDEDTCRMLDKVLGGAGYEVETRLDGRSALGAFREKRHDVVITDIRMPGMDGLEVLRALKSIEPDVGVIILSAVLEDRTKVAIEALRGGATDYLTKPLRDLADLERSVAISLERRASRRDAERRLRELESRARTDPLTGLANRLELEQRLGEEFSRLGRSLEGLSLALLDIDHFKTINDTFGHQAGDRILAGVAQALRENCRAYDVKARYGGDEFVVVMPDTRLEQGIAVAEKIRRAATDLPLRAGDSTVRVTLSAGVSSTSPFDGVAPEELVRRADLALYEAKRSGRNRTLPWVQGQPQAQVLIVDGDARDGQALIEMCASLGFRADCVSTGGEAIAQSGSSRYALVLVNVNLPDLNGPETIKRIRDLAPATSAALIRKPVSMDSLKTLLSEARART